MVRIEDILDNILAYNPNADLSLVKKAYIYCAKVHKGQARLSGEPYLSHPLEVAAILTKMKLDVVTIACGLLHDTVEDTKATLEEIEELFGKEVSTIVDGLTKLSKLSFSPIERQAENVRKMILAMAQDIRVILIKLADRLHNMITLGYLPPEKQRHISQETLDIYAPLAARLGIGWLKTQLEDLAFYYLEPEAYQRIAHGIAKRKEEEKKYIEEIKGLLENKLRENRLRGRVEGRVKSIYSIYLKMQRQQIDLEQIYDLVAFRIIVKTIRECYEALGMVHSLWKPIPKRFKDYIAMPKPNMYQSLHTTVIGPYGGRVEIQIRTEEMHRIAEEGIAAHWRYKEGKGADEKEVQRFAWLKQLLEWQRELKDPKEFLRAVKTDLFPQEVYVFTPKGDVKALPAGSTPVDFAYSIHTEIGNHCMGAKVDGRLVPLRYKLNTGNVVEIITSPKQHPSKDWLKFVRTPKAISCIKRYIRTQERDQAISLAKGLCEKVFKKYGLNFHEYLNSQEFSELAKQFSFKTVDDLLIAIGYGKISPKQIINRILPSKAETEEPPRPLVKRERPSGIKIKGVDDVMIKIGRCCLPIPGDKIVGYITRGHGITIHRVDCPNVSRLNPERLIEVSWDKDEKLPYHVKIKVRCLDKIGLLSQISGAISQAKANIIEASTKTDLEKRADLSFVIEVNNVQHLQRVIDAIYKIDTVLEVQRIGLT